MYGWRARLGLIIPSSNTTMESEFWRMAPEGVSVHTSRVRLRRVVPEELERMAEESVRAAEELASAGVDVIVYGCTTGSLLKGRVWEEELRLRIEKSSGVKTVTTAQAVVEALKVLNVRRLTVATPYIEDLNERERRFLEESGFEVLSVRGLGIADNLEIGRLPPWTAYRLALESFKPGSDALFVSCTNFRTIEVVAKLEETLGVPVVSSNTASMWLALRRVGIRDKLSGYGRLLELR